MKIQQDAWFNKVIFHFKEIQGKTVEANSKLKSQFFQFLPFLIASFLTGFFAFLYSKLFSFSEKQAFLLFEKYPLSPFIVTPVAFLFSWWVIKQFAPFAKGSGIPQVMAAVELVKPNQNHLIKQLLSLRIIAVKVLSSTVKVLGGGILGREGPTIQISSSIFNQVYKWAPKSAISISQKSVYIAGAASGLAAAFNTPLGGIIFAIEELSKYHIKYYKTPLFVAVIISGLTAQGFGGSYLYLGYPKTNFGGDIVYVGILLTAIATGLFGSLMCIVLLKFIKYIKAQKSNFNHVVIVVACGLFVAFFIYFFGNEAMGSGKQIMERTLFTDNKSVSWYLPFIRMNGLIASFSFGGAGGIFAPSLSAGACFGGVIADLLHLAGSNANLLILTGMTGFLTAVTRAPFTAAIITFEMTERHSIIFFLLLSAFIANVIASLLEKHSLYEILKGYYLNDITS
ncbi:chloride channel protein [Solitalea koreensis]|uniref:H+/Cl-antiporter ClcA n=1 Tax=Solitalea koreensis TaxID=543615 RepID=A0A521C4W7_9SPHI|nr:chloride channel protein [Solitalea koreensis]SMO53730.1 H+/Cl-antiporter ClcA [Solitalea koreensis]